MNIGPQARTVICSDDAEEILKKEIENNPGLDLFYQRLEWILSRAPYRGMKLDYPEHDFLLY